MVIKHYLKSAANYKFKTEINYEATNGYINFWRSSRVLFLDLLFSKYPQIGAVENVTRSFYGLYLNLIRCHTNTLPN